LWTPPHVREECVLGFFWHFPFFKLTIGCERGEGVHLVFF